MTWGCEDLSAAIGATATRDAAGRYLSVFEHARVQVLLAAKAAGVQAIDGVFTDLQNSKGLKSECAEGLQAGFDGKLSIHPNQIAEINAAFTPSHQEIADANELLALFAENSGAGAFRFKGQMVDEPHVKRARAVLARADAAGVSLSPALPSGNIQPAPQSSRPSVRPHHGKWFEELSEGLIIQHALTRTVTETDNILFTTMSLNPAALHLDYNQAQATEFGRPLVNSMFTVALLVGMSVLETTHGTTIANLGFDEVLPPLSSRQSQ
mmetsp:Transcript_32240/g.83651  ORF Transcript_32240/g.83651 Transcript_32240/m.83651 type:complete len:267 (+) Transcript_32240:108-908(+)